MVSHLNLQRTLSVTKFLTRHSYHIYTRGVLTRWWVWVNKMGLPTALNAFTTLDLVIELCNVSPAELV